MAGAATAVRPSGALFVILGCGAAVVASMWPHAVTPTVVFLIYLNVPAVLVRDYGLPVAGGALVPLLLVVPLAFHLHRGERLVFGRTFRLMLLYLVVQVISTFMSARKDLASRELQTFVLEGLVVYLLVANVVRTPTQLRRAVWAIIAAASTLAAATILQNLTGSFMRQFGGFAVVDPSYYYGQMGSPRASGPIGDPNYYGQILLVALALALLACSYERARLRFAAVASTALIGVAITFTSSRGTALAFAVVLSIMLFLRYVTRRQILVIAVGVTALLTVFPGYRARIATAVHLGGATAPAGSQEVAADASVRGRATEMLAAALVFADHPVVGVGPDVFPVYYQRYAALTGGPIHETVRYGAHRGEPEERVSHDMFLAVAADLGVAGLLVFAAIVVQTLRTLVQARRRWLRDRPDLAALATGLLLAVVAYLVTGLFLTLAYERYFWLLIALAGAAGSLSLSRDAVEAERAV